MFLILRPLRLLFKALVTESTPTRMSWGLALGVLMGVVPKGNLLAMELLASIGREYRWPKP